MSELECKFCNKIFNSLSSLNNHKKTAKYCLVIFIGLKNRTNKHIFNDHNHKLCHLKRFLMNCNCN